MSEARDLQRRIREAELRVAEQKWQDEQTIRRIQDKLHERKININMSESKPKTAPLVIEALIFTYIGLVALAILINILFYGASLLWPLVAAGVGGAIIIGLFGYAGFVWVSAWRASRSKRG